jgi:phospholipid/cholesterol/gamma-HCH transport system substrate-binding protein
MHRISWSQLRIGLAVSFLVTVSTVLVFFIDSVRDALEDRYSLHFHTFTTQVLRPRAVVWFAGQPVGKVRRLDIVPPTRGTSERLRVELHISVSAQPFITDGAMAQITTASMLGEAVINILPASEPGPPLADQSEIPTASELDPSRTTRLLEATYDSLGPVIERWRQVREQLTDGDGTLAQLLRNPEGARELQRHLRRLAATFDTVQIAASGFQDVFSDTAVRRALERIGPRIEQLAATWSDNEGTLGAIVTDTVMRAHLDSIARRVDGVSQRLDTGKGTLGRLKNDEALAVELERTREALEALRAELQGLRGRSGPSR